MDSSHSRALTDINNAQRFNNLHASIKEVLDVASSLDVKSSLQITSIPVQQLCRQLDMIFFHGLRKVTAGYWEFANNFTQKTSVTLILKLKNVLSSVGRGRAWLYLTLNENTLEYCVRSFSSSSEIVNKYYLEHAFLRDRESMELFRSATAGLQHVRFHLELDASFLDKSIAPFAESLTSQKTSFFFQNITSTLSDCAKSARWNFEELKMSGLRELQKGMQQVGLTLPVGGDGCKMRDYSSQTLAKSDDLKSSEMLPGVFVQRQRLKTTPNSSHTSNDSPKNNLKCDGSTVPEGKSTAQVNCTDREKVKSFWRQCLGQKKQYDIAVDNCLLNKLKTEVFKDNKENLRKMFCATVGHSDDKIKVVFIILTDCRFYIVEEGLCQRNFFVKVIIDYEDLDLPRYGLNKYSIHFSSKSKKQQYTICTGNKNFSENIVGNVAIVAQSKLGRSLAILKPSVPDETFAITKWIAKKTAVQPDKVKILFYGLIHCKDIQSRQITQRVKAPSKDGCLEFAFHNRKPGDKGDMVDWSTGYFLLKEGILYQYSTGDSQELKMYLRLKIPDVRGCCRVKYSSKPHAIEFRLGNGTYLRLSAKYESEARKWMQAILETISLPETTEETESFHKIIMKVKGCASVGEVMDEIPGVFRSCALILTPQVLFFCEEKFKTTVRDTEYKNLGSVHVRNINTIRVDEDEGRYCILKRGTPEENASSDDWILYFNSADETEEFFCALFDAQQTLAKDPFKVERINDTTLQQACRDRVQTLQNSWKLGYNMLKEPFAVIENNSMRE